SRVVFAAPPSGANVPFGYKVAVDSVGAGTNASAVTRLIRLNWRLGVAPVITNVSPNRFLTEGSAASIQVVGGNLIAPGVTNPIAAATYQWSFKGTALPGATNATLSLASARWEDAGRY